MNKKTTLYKQRYKCTNHTCSKTLTTELPDIIDKHCCYTKNIKANRQRTRRFGAYLL